VNLFARRTASALAFLVSAVVLAPVAFALLLAGWLAALLLAITPASVPVLVGFRWAIRQLALVEAWLARELLGAPVHVPAARRRGPGFWAAGKAVLVDRGFWRQQAYLALRVLGGSTVAIGEVSVLAAGGFLATLPLYYTHSDTDLGFTKIDSIGKALACVPAGLVVLAVAILLVRPLTRPFASAAGALLGRTPGPQWQETAASRRRRSLALTAHTSFYLLLNVFLVVVWVLSHRGYFWPEWTLITLGLPLAVHAIAEVVHRRRLPEAAVVVHAGVSLAFALFFVLVWAVTSRTYFWPAWPLAVLAVAFGVHALVARPAGIIRHLRETRAGAIDVQETELRRIERDLHDGAQARLVSLGMSLGLAEQRLAQDPAAARVLVAEAREGVGAALRELRDLARGIRPPILADRGLAAAIAALVHDSSMKVDVVADVRERPPAAVETAAYYVVSEALANAGKHAGASGVRVTLARRGDVLEVQVEDDGRGGADADGNGLRGLRRRVEALDGTFAVASPAGGPTVVRAELPCAS
jgi:signal transduction histidine kinase